MNTFKLISSPSLAILRTFGLRRLGIALSVAMLALSGVLLQSSLNVAQGSDYSGFEVVYSVDYNGMAVGSSIRTVLVIDSSTVMSTHELRPEGLALLFGQASAADITIIDLSNNQIRPVSSERTSSKASDSYAAEFIWTEGVVEFSGGNVVNIPANDVHDFESWIMDLMFNPDGQREGELVSIVERENRLRTYQILQVSLDILQVDGQAVNTRRIILQDIDNSSRGYSVWLAPGFHNLVVQTIKHRKSNDLKFLIKRFGQIAAGKN